MKSEVNTFLCCTGNAPSPDISTTRLREKLLKRVELKQEELDEMKQALLDYDWVEVLDAVLDQKYYLIQDELDLEAVGFDVVGAGEAVCLNNEYKYTTNYDLIRQAQEDKRVLDKYVGALCINGYENDVYYCLVTPKGKVIKWEDHPFLDLTSYVPKEFGGVK